MSINKKNILLLAKKGIEHEVFDAHYSDLDRELFLANGLEISLDTDGKYRFNTAHIPYKDATFCIVDIETNGSNKQKHQIIEIGAVKLRHGKLIEQFESLIHCNEISQHITEITGIDATMTQNSPDLCTVLEQFKLFLGQDIFVAHAVKFDYSFTSAMLQRCGFEALMNRTLCTIDLAERTISSYRYGLSYLNEQLSLYQSATHHRALSDAITAAKLLQHTLQYIPKEIDTAEALIAFSKEASRKKRPKFDPSKEAADSNLEE